MNPVKPRTTEVHRIYLWNARVRTDFSQQQVLSNILSGFFKYCMQNTKMGNAYEPDSNKFFWLSDYSQDSGIYKLLWNYSKTGRRLKIIKKNTLSPTKEKSKDEGDLEKQHALIKDYAKRNRAVLVFEKVQGGITTRYIEDELNNYIIEYFPKLASAGIRLNIDPIISKDFVGNIYKMDRISFASIWVDKNTKIITNDEDMMFADEDGCMRDEIELTIKAKRCESLSRIFIEKLLRLKKDSKGMIKRIVVEGKSNNGPIKLDTESIKLKRKLDILLDEDGQIDSDDIFEKYQHFINYEFDDNLVDSFLLKNRTPVSQNTDTM